MFRLRWSAAAVVIVLAVLVALAGPVPASASGLRANGRIVWSHFTSDNFAAAAIVSTNLDGSGLRTLTRPEVGMQDIDPVPSPDGRWVVFERDSAGGSAIVLVRADGTGQRTVKTGCVDPCVADAEPGWTPDGHHLTFTRVLGPFNGPHDSARSAVLYVSSLDGRQLRRLSQPGIDGVYEDYRARWSPDAGLITFVRIRNSDIRSAVFAMDANGTGVRQLTPWELDADLPDLSQARRGPTANLVVFETYGHGAPAGASQDIATVPTDCESLAACMRRTHFVTHNGAGPTVSANPGWSPDGRRLVFAEWSETTFADIWTANPDGSDRRRVTTSPLWDFRPSWAIQPLRTG